MLDERDDVLSLNSESEDNFTVENGDNEKNDKVTTRAEATENQKSRTIKGGTIPQKRKQNQKTTKSKSSK